jgi:peroxiredoxin
LRDRYAEIQELGAEVVVIGTGDLRYARAFAEEERIPFPVLVDDDARAADAARVERVGIARLFALASLLPTARALRAGYGIGRPGKRVNQLGATFVVAPGGILLLRHYDAHPADHAPMPAIFDALRRSEAKP